MYPRRDRGHSFVFLVGSGAHRHVSQIRRWEGGRHLVDRFVADAAAPLAEQWVVNGNRLPARRGGGCTARVGELEALGHHAYVGGIHRGVGTCLCHPIGTVVAAAPEQLYVEDRHGQDPGGQSAERGAGEQVCPTVVRGEHDKSRRQQQRRRGNPPGQVADTVLAAACHAQRLRGVTGITPDIPIFPESPTPMVPAQALTVTEGWRSTKIVRTQSA